MKNNKTLWTILVLMIALLLVHPVLAYIVPSTALYIPANGTVPFVDLSPRSQTITNNGGVAINAGAPVYSETCLEVNGTNYLSTTTTGMNLGSNPWYIGMWFNETRSVAGENGTFIMVNTNGTSSPYAAFSIQRLGTDGTTNLPLQYKASVNGTTWDFIVNGTHVYENSTWNYVACNRSSGLTPTTGGIWCYVNGTFDANISIPHGQSMYYNSTSGRTLIGVNNPLTNYTTGQFDDIVIINGNGYNPAVVPPWEYTHSLKPAFRLNHTAIWDFRNDTTNLINVTTNVYDITTTGWAWTYGDPDQPLLTSALAMPLGVNYRHQGIFTITETVNNTYTSATNTSFVFAWD